MGYLGTRAVSSTVYVPVTTHAQTGAAVAPSSALEVGDFLLYKNGSAVQRASTSGWTIASPFDSITGLHMLTIDLSDNTDAGFYASGAYYDLVLSPDETVDGLAVVRVVASWDIGVVPANVTQWLGTAVSTPTVAGVPNVNAKTWNDLATVALPATPTNITAGTITTATNVTTVNGLAAGVITATSIAADAITDAKVASDVTIASVTGAVGSVTGAVGSVTGAVGSVTAIVTANLTQIDGEATTGNYATLNLRKLNVINDAGDALVAISSGANGYGVRVVGNGAGSGLSIQAGSGGNGLDIGSINGNGINVLISNSGHGMNIAAFGTNKHGILVTGGTGGTSDGIKAVAGTGGVDIRGNITGNVTGNVSGSAGSVTGAVGSVTGAVGSVTGLTASNLDATISSRMATYTQPTGFLAATFPNGTVANTTNLTAGTITTVGNVSGNVDGNVTGSVGSVVGAVGSVTGLTAANVGAIKTQTDKLVFTVANQVDVNIQSVNDITVNGVGSAIDPWSP